MRFQQTNDYFLGTSGRVVLDGQSERIPEFYVLGLSEDKKLIDYFHMELFQNETTGLYFRVLLVQSI